MNTIAAIASAIANVFSWLTGRSNLRNAPDVRQAAINQADAAAKDAAEKAVAEKNLDEIRKLGSE